MKIKTSELTGPALDWAVAKCEFEGCEDWDGTLDGVDAVSDMGGKWFLPSTDWAQGGPIIEREGIELYRHHDGDDWIWGAKTAPYNPTHRLIGPTPLIAAMRCHVASTLGDEVEVPEELK